MGYREILMEEARQDYKHKKIMARLYEHFDEATFTFNEKRIVGLFLQGSQNYHLETPFSDVDSKLVVTPTFEEIAFNQKPVSTTHIRENEEHIDFKDIRLMIGTFKKQNLNFLEILFTPYFIINPMFEDEWNRLVLAREEIARYNQYQAIRSMEGIAQQKYHALKHPYPSKMAILERFGYDPKQLHHLLRIEDYLERYIAGEKYASCLIPNNPEYLKEVKMGLYDLKAAEQEALRAKTHIENMVLSIDRNIFDRNDSKIDELFNEVQYNIMKIAIKEELGV